MGFVVLGAAALLALSQLRQATLTGVVVDNASGAPIIAATVTLADSYRSSTTGADGRYELTDVPAGTHPLVVRALGYASRSLQAVVPTDGLLAVNVTLIPAPTFLPTLAIRLPRSPVGDERPHGDLAFHRLRDGDAIYSNPMLTEPDVLQSIAGGVVVVRQEAPTGLQVRGGDAQHTGYLLDEVPVLNPYHAAGLFSAWSPEAVDHVALGPASANAESPAALSGSIVGRTRTPSPYLRIQSSASNTHAGVTIDGPLGVGNAGFLLSVRAGLLGVGSPRHEPSYLHGELGDRLLKLEAPALGGVLHLLAYDNDNALLAARETEASRNGVDPVPRNALDWSSRSLGTGWERSTARGTVRVVGWSASTRAGIHWEDRTAALRMASRRHDAGVLISVDRRTRRARSAVALRVERSATDYRVADAVTGVNSVAFSGGTHVASVSVRHEIQLPARAHLNGSLAAEWSGGRWRLASAGEFRMQPSTALTIGTSYARTNQYAQSLRNPESLVGQIFPADLFVASDNRGVPVATSALVALWSQLRFTPSLRMNAEVYDRQLRGLMLVAPGSDQPFATGAPDLGSGRAVGAAVDAEYTSPRARFLVSFAAQQLTRTSATRRYTPEQGARRLVEGGAIVTPGSGWSLRLGVAALFGRRATMVDGPVEWEACNLLDRGCELAGTPHYSSEQLGQATLPRYVRADVGIRREMRFGVGHRESILTLFGAATNVFGRRNVLTYARDPSTGGRSVVEMRPQAPLVVGLEWRR